jgi:hypothetical protein
MRVGVPDDFDSIEVRTRVSAPTTVAEARQFFIPMQVRLAARQQLATVFAYVYPTPQQPDSPSTARCLRDAVCRLADRHGAHTAFVTRDIVTTFFPYAAVTGLNPYAIDWRRYLAGYYWGNLLTGRHIEALGGVDALALTKGITVEEGRGWWWVQLDEPQPTCDRPRLRRLADLLGPLLPEGGQTVEEYFATAEVVEDYCF